MTLRPLAVGLALALCACKAPPPAPQGLDESARYMIRNFYQDDAVFGAGVTGYLDWFENGGGKELVGVVATPETDVTSFTVSPLVADDVAQLPLDAEIVLEPGDPGPEDDVLGPRDLSKAVGVIAVDEIPCTWPQIEALLLGPDPASIFPTYEAYKRTYLTSSEVFFDASARGAFVPMADAFDPHAPGADVDAYAPSLMLTDNLADPAPQPLVGDLPPFELRIEARHGEYTVGDGTVGLAAVLSYAPGAMWEEGGGDGMRQTFAMEMLAELHDTSTLRMLAVWSEPDMLGVDPSAPIALYLAVQQAQSSNKDMRAACEALQAE
jgi:hypothetical protein